MQYSMAKAIQLFRINKLTTREKQELFLLLQTHPDGALYASSILEQCELDIEQRNAAFMALKRNTMAMGKFFINGKFSPIEREEMFKLLLNDISELMNLIREKKLNLKEVARTILIIKDYDSYKDDKLSRLNFKDFIGTLVGFYHSLNPIIREKLFQVFLKNKTAIYWCLKVDDHAFNDNEKMIIYQKHGGEFYTQLYRSLEELYNFCYWFQHSDIYVAQDRLTQMILKNQKYDMALKIKKNKGINLPEDLFERVDALLLMAKLNGNEELFKLAI